MSRVDIVLVGFGNVGRAFARLVIERRAILETRYGLSPRLRAVFRSTGGIALKRSSILSRLLEEEPSPSKNRSFWDPRVRLSACLPRGVRGVLVECAASNVSTGEPGLGHIRLALDRGWNIVTADKGPLVVHLRELRKTAERRGLGLGWSAAAGAALPAIDISLRSLAGTEVKTIEGILNGTTNYILTRMEQGTAFNEALREAQAKGIAEPDPSRDIEGLDTAVKLLLIANAAMGLDLELDDIEVESLRNVCPGDLESARQASRKLKYLGRIELEAGAVKAEVKARAIARDHPLFGVDGTQKGVTFLTDTMGAVTVTGGKSDPLGAAAALLKDIINIYRR